MRPAGRWFLGLLLGAAVAHAARRRDALSGSGAVGAAGVGATVFGASGLRGAALLLVFFGGSTALSRLTPRSTTRTQRPPEDVGTVGTVRTVGTGKKPESHGRPGSADAGAPFSRPRDPRVERTGPRRTLAQVLANGGVPAVLTLAASRVASPRLSGAYGGALAAANSDTWATEIGRHSLVGPRMITTGRPVERGVSGAVTPLGTLASLGGAALIGAAWAALTRSGGGMALRLTVAGCAGSLADSMLGATVQGVYACRRCGRRTEDRAHAHGDIPPALTRVRGLPFMSNDAVNLCASLTGAVVGACLYPSAPPRRGRSFT